MVGFASLTLALGLRRLSKGSKELTEHRGARLF